VHQKGILIVGSVMVVAGAAMLVFGGIVTRNATGEWLGHRAPAGALAVAAGGIFLGLFGLLVCAACAVLVLAERSGLRRRLETPILPDTHPIARFGRLVLRLNGAVHYAVLAFVLCLLIWSVFGRRTGSVVLLLLLLAGYAIWRVRRARAGLL